MISSPLVCLFNPFCSGLLWMFHRSSVCILKLEPMSNSVCWPNRGHSGTPKKMIYCQLRFLSKLKEVG